MKDFSTLENENSEKHHYYIIGKDEKKLIEKLEKHLNFYTLRYVQSFLGREIVYDVANNMLSNAGLVLSKQYEDDGGIFFKVRKISFLPKSINRKSKKFYLAECSGREEPKDFPIQIANAIQSSFSQPFTIDLVSIVRQTVPKIEILVHGKKYHIIGGFGYRARFIFEKTEYKDLISGKKVGKYGVTFIAPVGPKNEQYNNEILSIIDKYCTELVPYKQTRFEIAKRVLFPEPYVEDKKNEEEE